MGAVEEKFRKKTPLSAEFAERAARVIPGGETRSSVYHPPYSVVIERGKGPRVWDVDGNEYLDVNNNYTVLVHGHAFEPVVEAATSAVANGSNWSAKARAQVELAEKLVDRVDSVDEVRFANSGSEGVQSALAIARGYNRRSKILVSTYAYHGHFLDSAKYMAADASDPDFVPTYIGEWGNAESFEKILDEHGDEITAVLLEPWLGAGGMVAAPVEFFERVQAAARRAGALFVFDEATVFRLTTGGAQKLLGIEPDLTVLGKMVGGGFPVGGVGGKREYMELANPVSGRVAISGTFTGNPVTMAAGNAAIEHYTDDKIERMNAHAEQIDDALRGSAARYGLPYSSRRVGSLINVWFSSELPAANHVREDGELATLFHLSCMANGVFATPRALLNTTAAMTDDDVAETTQRLDSAIADMANEI